MRSKRLLSCAMAVSVIACTAWFCGKMSNRNTEETAVTEIVFDEVQSPDLAQTCVIDQSSISLLRTSTVVVEPIPSPETVLSPYIYLDSVPLTDELQAVMQDACSNYNVPYSLALAVTEIESAFDVDADNGLCVGLMQINECNFGWLRKLSVEPTEYEGNITAGVLMLGELLEKYQDTHKALMAYNCGETGASRLWKQGYETSRYSRKVVEAAQEWQLIIDNN